MMDAYSFHASEEDLKREYANMRKAYLEIFEKLGLEAIPVKALNGDMGGKISEEFMFLSEAGEDTILVSKDKTIAFNKEILELENAEEYLKNNYGITDIKTLEEKHCIELGHIFQLGQKYSTTMKGTFKSADNIEIPYYMGCYGIGVSRTLAAICEQNCDEEGLIWNKEIAPYLVNIIYTPNKKENAEKLYDNLKKSGIKVVIDDRENLRLGAKIKDWKIFGIPYLIVIGDKTEEDTIEIENRKDGKKQLIKESELVNFLK